MVCAIAAILFWGGKACAQETSSNVSFAESGDDNSTLTVTVTGTTTDADAVAFETQLSGKSYSKIVFVGGGAVNDAFVTKLNGKTSIEVLDLGGVFVEKLSSATIPANLNSNWKELTIPKTNVVDEEMVLPSALLSNYQWTNGLSLKVVIPEGYTKIADKAFQNYGKVTSLSLPSTLKTIGKFAFASTGLTELSLPEGLDKVDDGAFYELKSLTVVKLNEKLRYIGAGAFGRSSSEKAQRTITIPETVRFIGPYAFAERHFSDVYFQGKDAPVCPYGVFNYDSGYGVTKMWGTAFTGNDDKVHYCNGGYAATGNALADNVGQGYANRENYVNGHFYMTIMHYPTDANNPDKYSDQSRKYETKFDVASDGTESFTKTTLLNVGQETEQLKYYYNSNSETPDYSKGNAGEANNYSGTQVEVGYRDTYVGADYIWPSQSQFIRAYVNAGLGLKWDGVSKVDTELSPEDEEVLKEAGYDLTDETLSYNAFLGTRKFALANADVKSSPNYPIDVKGGQWWTLCVPFNMTKKMVDETFGVNTEVCLFDRVVRQVNRTTKTNRVILYFTQNVYAHKCEPKNADGTWNFSETAAAPDEDDIVVYAHEAYMIHPTKTDDDAVFVVNNYEPVEGNPTPTIVTGKNQYVGESDIPDNVPYRYVGNYLAKSEARNIAEVKIPKFSYVYASAGDEPAKFWFLTDDQMTWKPNKCVVQLERGAGEDDYQEFFDYNASGAKQASFFGEDFCNNSTTGIDDMVIVAGEENAAAVYNLNGVLVSKTGDMSDLPKGIYVKGGKKYVVK